VIGGATALTGRELRAAADELAAALESGGRAPDAILRAADGDPRCAPELARLVYVLVTRLWSAPGRIDLAAVGELRERAEPGSQVATALDVVSLWGVVDRYVARHDLRHADYPAVSAHGPALLDAVDAHPAAPDAHAKLMLRAMLTSAFDRPAAARLFAAARACGPAVGGAIGLHDGSATYFAPAQLAAAEGAIAGRRDALTLVGAAPEAAGEDDTLLLFSCDPVFFAAYFPYWAFAAEYLKARRLHLHFILAGGEPDRIVDRASAVLGGIADLRGFSRHGANVSFSAAAVPDYVAEPRTFYACARYLFARRLAAGFGGRVVIADVDMALREDPAAFLANLRQPRLETRFSVVVSRGTASVMPWRRYMAGTLIVPRAEPGATAMRLLEDYILAGLDRQPSWTLDQNALTYTVERLVAAHGADVILDTRSLKRPFAQETVRRLYESEQRRHGSA
jgi:hypothetical protein